MPLVDAATYRRLSGDTTTADSDVDAAIVDAIAALEDGTVLNRRLPRGWYTERLRVSPHGHVYPSAIPLSAVNASSTYEVGSPTHLRRVGASITGGVFDVLDWPEVYASERAYAAQWPAAEVTYEGGFTAETLPFAIKRAIVLVAKAVLTDPGAVQAGIVSRSVGDVSITSRTADASASAVDAMVPGLWASIKPWRRRTP